MKWDARDYQENSAAQYTWAMELVAKLGLRGDERLLDIGSGDGKVTAQLALALPRGSVLGVDQSEEMVRYAQDRFAADKFPNLAFQLGEAAALDFASEFDVVFSNATLHWVKDHRPVLAGIGRALKPGGRALLQMGGRGNAAGVRLAMEAVMRRDAWAGYFTDHSDPYGFHGPEEYAEWLTAAGLRAKRVELLPRDMTQHGHEGLAGWIRTTWMPYTHRVPEKARERFISEVVEAYLQDHPADPDGKVHVGMVRLEVEARKDERRRMSDTKLYHDAWSVRAYDHLVQYQSDVPLWLDLAARAGGPVLELACGSLRALLPIARAGYQVVGLDLSPHMLKRASEKVAQESAEVQARVRLVEGSMAGFDLGEQFGLIYVTARSFQFLLTRAEQRHCLETCARHLKPGGYLGIDVFNTRLSRLVQPGGVDEEPDESTGPGGEAIRETGHSDYDHTTQTLRWRSRQEWSDACGGPQVREYVCDLHYFFRFEMEWMLEACGFAVEALYGNFDRSEFTAESQEMVFVARRL
jgi:trans-aconitate 2-methyltransferase